MADVQVEDGACESKLLEGLHLAKLCSDEV